MSRQAARVLALALTVTVTALVGLAPHAAAGAPAAAAPTLDDTLATLARAPGLAARFTEEKQIALLAVPLRSEGTLNFAPGHGLVRRTLKPSPQTVLVTDSDLSFWDGRTTKRISLSSSPALAAFARSFALVLTANRPALEKSFTLAFRPRPSASDAWELDLVPTDPDLKRILQSIHFEGQGIALSLLVVHETSGDVSTSHFTDVDTARHYTDAEASAVFTLPPG